MTNFELIEEARIALNLKANEVEKYLKTSHGAYTRWKRGSSLVPFMAVIALRAAANLDFEEAPKPTFKGFQKFNGVRVREGHAVGIRKPNERSVAMREMYVSGITLQQIGEKYGISRERVRQVLARDFGVSYSDGGAHVAVVDRSVAKKETLEAKCKEKFGCTVAQYKTLAKIGDEMVSEGRGRCQTPTYAYSGQRRNAKARNIEWDLSLWEWWLIWQASGKWTKRGVNGYVMARHGDVGPYSKANVKIITSAENVHEALNTSGLPVGVSPTRDNRFKAVRYNKQLGIFDSAADAKTAYLKAYRITGVAVEALLASKAKEVSR